MPQPRIRPCSDQSDAKSLVCHGSLSKECLQCARRASISERLGISSVFVLARRDAMRQLVVATLAVVALVAVGATQAQAGKIEVKGVHLCCPQCVKAVAAV